MLTPAQCATLKALAMADQTAAALIDAGNDIALADWFNTPTANYIWRSSVPVDEVFDTITWANLTPVDVPDDSAAYTNRALLCQANDATYSLAADGANYPDAEFVLAATFSSVPTEGGVLALYARPPKLISIANRRSPGVRHDRRNRSRFLLCPQWKINSWG